MDESSYVVILAVFDDDELGSKAYKDLHQAEKDKKIDLENTVLVTKDEKGKIRIHEEAEKIAKEVGVGALVGGALGLLAGPAGLIALGAIGAALGGVSAKFDDVGFDDTRLKKLGERLEPDHSAIIAVLEAKYSDPLVAELKNRNARVAVEDLPKDFKETLEADWGFAYRIAADETREAAFDLGLAELEVEDYVSSDDDSEASPSDDSDAGS